MRGRFAKTADYQVAVLEVASPLAGTDGLFRMESRWKEKLLTRGDSGLNAN